MTICMRDKLMFSKTYDIYIRDCSDLKKFGCFSGVLILAQITVKLNDLFI